jgi:hypothetical protein
MVDLGPATEDQVILAWLQAEIESPRFQRLIVGSPPNMTALAAVRQLAHQSNLGNAVENAQRRAIISSPPPNERP